MPPLPIDRSLHPFLDALPDGVVYHRIIPHTPEHSPDFELHYVNERARDFAKILPPLDAGQSLRPEDVQALRNAYRSDEVRYHRGTAEICQRKLFEGVLTLVRTDSSHRYQTLLDQTPLGIVALQALRDDAGQIVDFRLTATNEAGWRLAGLAQGAIGRTLLEVRPGHADSGLIEAYARVVETGEPFDQELFYEADGLRNWYAVVAKKFEAGIVLTFQIITEQKTARVRAEEQARLFEGVVNASLNGIITYRAVRNDAGQIVDFQSEIINQVAASILRLPDQVPGWRMLERFPGVDRLGLFARYVHVVETGEPLRFETPYATDGLQGWYDVATVKLGDGFVITFNDISETRNAVLETERQRSMLNAVVETSPSGLYMYEPIADESGTTVDFRTTFYNQKICELLEVDEATLRDCTMRQRNPDSANYIQRLQQVIDTGEIWQTEYQLPGRTRWLNVIVARLGSGLISTVQDITESKQASARIEAQKNLLEGVLTTSLNGTVVYEAIRDAAGRITDFSFPLFNETARQDILRRTGRDIRGNTLLGVYPDSRRSGLFAIYARATEGAPPVRLEHHYADLDIWYDVSISQLNDGCVVTFIDISESKRVTQAIRQQSELLGSVLDGSVSGILACRSIRDAAGTLTDFEFISANQTAADLVFKSLDELVSGTLLTLFPGTVETGLFDLYKRTTETGEPGRTETYYNHDGLDFWLDITSRQLGDGLVITFTDVSEARRASQAIERAAEHLQAVIDYSQTGIFVFSPIHDETGALVDFRFKTINRMVAALVGQTPDVVTGAVASDWFISYRETGLFDRYRHTFETGEEQRFDINYTVDGFDVWFDVQSVKFGGDVLVTFTNYTDLKQAQRAVEGQADLLNSVLNSSINGIMAFTSVRDAAGQIVDFTFISVNESACQMVSKTADELLGKTVLNIFPGNVESGLFAHYVHTTETGEPGRTELYYALDGLDFWLDISFRQLGDGFVVTFTDVSLVKRAAQQVERSAQELQTVIDTSQTGIFLFTPVRDEAGAVVDFRFRVANRQLSAYVGQDPQAVIGALGSRWFPGYQTNGLFERYRDTYLSGQTNRFDFHYDDDGIDVWLDIMSTKVGDEVLVTFADYTPLKRLQLELEGTVQQLQTSNENLERFAYVASHDLQEPLRKIQSFGDLIIKRHAAVLPPDAADKLGRMQAAAERMQNLINDLLTYSRLSSVKEALRRVDLARLLAEVRTDLEVSIREKHATLQVDPLPIVTGDALQLRQLFQNLLSNALKFTSSDTTPRVEVRHRIVQGEEVPDALDLQPRTRYHEISVRDNGIGFDQQYAAQVFEAFRRLHNRAEYPGTGIGLAIVKKVVENHGGDVVVQSQLGVGTTFRVYLAVNDQ